MPFETLAAAEYGRVRVKLKRAGTPISDRDTLLAAHSKSLGLKLVTNNIREFHCVEGLSIEDWTTPRHSKEMLALRNTNEYNLGLEGVSLIMARTSNIYARIDPELKEQAETILRQLGIPMSNAIGLFLRQVVMQRGIPFQMKLPAKPLTLGSLSEGELNAELEKGYADYSEGRVISADRVAEKMKRDYNI